GSAREPSPHRAAHDGEHRRDEGRERLPLLPDHAGGGCRGEGTRRADESRGRPRARRRAHRSCETLLMRFLVCLKQVPDSTVRVKVGTDGRAIATEGVTWSISPYDEYAVELALERKDADPTTVVSVVTLGPARARDALRQALAMGCDDAT